MITVACHQCGAKVETYPSRRKRKKFCGRACYWTWLSKHQRGKAHPMFGRKHSEKSLAKMRAEKRRTVKRGPENPRWKGGRWLARGYVMVSLDALKESERAAFRSMASRNHRAIPEHRLVMAREMGRPLLASEIVHHKNGVKSDNRRRNLEMADNSTHKRSHTAILRELRALRRENERLRSLLATCHPDGSATSVTPA